MQRADLSWRDCGVFSKKEGGEVDSESTSYYPGGLAPAVALANQATVGNLTLTALQALERQELVRFLRTRAGRAECVASGQPLDPDGNAFGPPDVVNGILKRVSAADYDAQSTDAAEFEVELTPHGTIG